VTVVDDLVVAGSVAVVTGGASGIGRAISRALATRGATVVIADIEAPVLEATVGELAGLGDVEGVRTDVSDPASVTALADHVFADHGRCNLLFNNAGVTSGGGGLPWLQESNDWLWCFGVNVFGVANGVSAFVPRMIDSGEPGQVVNTSSGDGGFAPVPRASVYASSKAAVSCFTGCTTTSWPRAPSCAHRSSTRREGSWTPASSPRPATAPRTCSVNAVPPGGRA